MAAYRFERGNMEIEVRAWDGETMLSHSELCCASLSLGEILNSGWEIMLYTCKKDKNGKKIFLHDIYTRKDGKKHIVKFGDYQAGGLDYYAQSAYGFYGDCITEPGDADCPDEYVEIIGNKWENPELLRNKP